MGATSRKVDGDRVENFPSKFECPGIIDTGASKTVIGQKKVKTLIQSMPIEVQKKMIWKKSETVFRFGTMRFFRVLVRCTCHLEVGR